MIGRVIEHSSLTAHMLMRSFVILWHCICIVRPVWDVPGCFAVPSSTHLNAYELPCSCNALCAMAMIARDRHSIS